MHQKLRLVIFFFLVLTLLVGCTANEDEKKNGSANLTNVSVQAKVDQTISEKAKEELAKMKEITEVRAINTEEELLVGFDVKQMKRLKIKSIEAKVEKKLKKLFPDHKIYVYSDRKILIEAEDIEAKVQDGSFDKKKLTKEIDTLKDLMKGQTTHKDMHELFSN
ncbi:YhcN/YlaJ family sporulation lipoprotein [Bacillus taeanensis]|uniref:Sporulation protein n=1 Tax=Bacillus taeanensis TaxID=273032 RepID=A0A366XTV5_9BACI|nr:YhcN/YlaJ family sporulation lipoprotein [Bacillus taeanensis]RBW67391.1 hypothetical protein DS031_22595 [Bacillus taeanensis]